MSMKCCAMHLQKGVHLQDPLSTQRFSEGACIRGFTDKFAIANEPAIAEHALTEDHPICREDTRMLQCASQTMTLIMKETICIQMTPESLHFNGNVGYNIPDCWITMYKKLRDGACTGCAI